MVDESAGQVDVTVARAGGKEYNQFLVSIGP